MAEDRIDALLNRSPAQCFGAFCDVRFLTQWVPSLRRATVVRTAADGRPLEVKFEHGASRTYSLVYAYDDAARSVRWVPGVGAREAVSGEARFDAEGSRCRMTYALTGGPAREEIGEAAAIVAAFVRWVESLPAS